MPAPSPQFLSQHARLLEIKTALPEAALFVERFSGREAVSESFRFEIDCISTDVRFDLADLNATELTLRLLQADGSRRAWHGYVTQAMQLGADGGLARYRLVVESFLAFLAQRRDCYLFQDKTVIDIVGQILADHPEANWRNEVTQSLRTYSIATQYRETDVDFMRRLLAEEGLSFRFEHDQTASAGDDSTHARHRLVVFDRLAELPDGAQPSLRFHRNDATEASDTVQVWQEVHATRPNAFSLAGWDYKTLAATSAEAESNEAPKWLPRLEIHDASRAYRFEDGTAARLRTDLSLAAQEAAYVRYRADSSVRQLAEGTRITLTQHAAYVDDAARFTVLAVDHAGANNLGSEAARLLGQSDVEAGTYRNRFLVQPASRPVVPGSLPRPVVGSQVARVVGLPGEAVTTERDHRIKIQYPWQRGATPNAGGLNESGPAGRSAGKSGNAPGNDQSGTWVRVAEWLSGANWGSQFLPRLETEVLVDFIDGDIDRPIVVGQAHNGADAPPFAAGHDSAANHPGVLSGWTSHNFEQGHNQWVLDDAPGQLRTRLAASENASELALGHLIHQVPASATRGAWRGSGFELRTDAWMTVRAGEGILLSATARANAQSSALDTAEAVAQLHAAAETAKALSRTAAHQRALPLAAQPALDALLAAVDPQQDGKFTASTGGQEAKKAQPGSRMPSDPTERMAEPRLVAEAPTDLALSTPASAVLFAGQHLHATAQEDFHLASAHTIAATTGHAFSAFAHAGGIVSVAQAGDHSLQAHTDRLEILADKAITVTSTNDEIHLLAKRKIVLTAGRSSVTLDGKNITFACPGKFSVKGNHNAFLGPGNGAQAQEKLPDSRVKLFDEQIRLVHEGTEIPVANQPYRITASNGDVFHGVTDSNGYTERVSTDTACDLDIEIFDSLSERTIE